jgi:hypothetical protein
LRREDHGWALGVLMRARDLDLGLDLWEVRNLIQDMAAPPPADILELLGFAPGFTAGVEAGG